MIMKLTIIPVDEIKTKVANKPVYRFLYQPAGYDDVRTGFSFGSEEDARQGFLSFALTSPKKPKLIAILKFEEE